MDFLANIIGTFLFTFWIVLHPLPPTPTITHVPAPVVKPMEPKEFTIEKVNLASPAPTSPKKKKISLGAVLTIEQKLAQEESLYAEIDPTTGIVLRVLVVSQSTLNTGILGDTKNWVRTSNSGTIRKNYAGAGFVYDKTNDEFLPPAPITKASSIPASFYTASTTP